MTNTIQYKLPTIGFRRPIFPFTILAALFIALTPGCSSIAWYAQSVAGQLEISGRQQPISEVLQDEGLTPHVRRQLERVRDIRDFAATELGLPDNNSYREYADLDRDYVVWNVFAAPKLSLEALEWCYLFVGCLNYRGYFDRNDASQLARELQEQGFDVFTGGVAAYSTLGWFDDPVLNTMLRWDEARLATVIFHELAHQLLYIRDDTKFNEAFADTVAVTGVRRWLEQHGTPAMRRNHKIMREQEDAFLSLVFRYRDRLSGIYASSRPDALKLAEKKRLLAEMTMEYRRMNEGRASGRYDDWFENVNNASLLAVITYRDYLPGFRALLAYSDYNLPDFYRLAEELGHCPPAQRRRILEQQQTEFECRD
ncbi:MAG TPA: aminopeptidase [Gammaproteobacteria bacterium]|nr:aminopeptidase [Gammaproteobacteria bacterium]